MQTDVQLKQFELADETALLSFLRTAYPDEPRRSDAVFWRWQFLENPYTDLDNIPLWIVKKGEEVVGQMAAIPVELKVGEEQKPALWIVDYILHPDYRGHKLGKSLLEIPHQAYCKTLMALGYNKNAEKPMRSLKWELLGNISRYHKLLFPGNAAKELSRLGIVREIVNFGYAPFRPSMRSLSKSGSGKVREMTSFDSSFDTLWQEASVQWTCAVVRSSRLLEWQFMQQPGKKFDVLGYYENERLAGYVVLFFRKPESGGARAKAAISDLCYSASEPARIIDELLKAALRLAIERRAGSLVTDVLDRRVEERLRHFGFWPIKAAPPFAANVLERQDVIYKLDNWFLTRADSDVSIFEGPNL
jgi:GNAT superfamily N-acetyltransferase